ncbi:diacylglycerol kinase [bacterium BMS3Bbin06]|nr:diacylglycerol kinase [bacterium BMS3Bbin06]HDH00386.1 diacylglycerol kinase family lipid kinase [Nitrospirota bacterium]HDO35328.1 diacylglycerol kinase family lipid kinase [Nitrospirota bacterium]HDY71656.1 diacylglycerol kinase family lipid kinase [Nitrospirota bacterium]
MNSSAALIINPSSGSFSKKRMDQAIKLIEGRFKRVDACYTRGKGDGERLAQNLVRVGYDIIFVVGGDGTFNEVANGAAFSDIPIGFIPSGTTNVLTKELGIPNDIYGATFRILSGTERYISLGRMNRKYFICMAGIGFDAEAVFRVNPFIKRLSGRGAHIVSGLSVLLRYNPSNLSITIDGRAYQGTNLIVCNGRLYAGNYTVCPEADIERGSLQVFILHGTGRKDLMRCIYHVVNGTLKKMKGATLATGRNISISGRTHIQADGEFIGFSPAEISIRERALKILS